MKRRPPISTVSTAIEIASRSNSGDQPRNVVQPEGMVDSDCESNVVVRRRISAISSASRASCRIGRAAAVTTNACAAVSEFTYDARTAPSKGCALAANILEI